MITAKFENTRFKPSTPLLLVLRHNHQAMELSTYVAKYIKLKSYIFFSFLQFFSETHFRGKQNFPLSQQKCFLWVSAVLRHLATMLWTSVKPYFVKS